MTVYSCGFILQLRELRLRAVSGGHSQLLGGGTHTGTSLQDPGVFMDPALFPSERVSPIPVGSYVGLSMYWCLQIMT